MAEKKSTETAFKKGDRVTWSSSGGEATGKVVRKATTDGKIKDFEYKASKDEPKYVVETDEGEQAAHKPESLRACLENQQL
ncbi:MAG: hypothetical protein AVDCRST_MAG74-36 [uncultured Pyrinomonadaceae bacterium]|uniref:Hypervirulence associated protein TUDOR domain-containing protein n=1 Tax=uncultured Pyrinomonadaceae bacterium TaxID=2283094 RepID=A0A6J4N720_9BACT|nr:MAG: hypothetical protein AVDCRST_MAG74-36 [uncultured Pyrinomonadaceae bacterium]